VIGTLAVTGASGHLGLNVVHEALRRKLEVVAVVRTSSTLHVPGEACITRRDADILNPGELRGVFDGCDVVVHCAAEFKRWSPIKGSIRRTAIEGSYNVVCEAARAGVKRFIYTSSVAAIGTSNDPSVLLDESYWNNTASSEYFRAKVEAETLVVSTCDKLNLELVSFCPGSLFGPLDYRLTPTMRLLRDMLLRRAPSFRGGINICDVEYVARVYLDTATNGCGEQRYILGGENLTYAEIGLALERLAGIRPRHLGYSPGVMVAIAKISEGISILSGSEPLLTLGEAKDNIGRFGFYDLGAAQRDFGLSTRTAEETLARAISWLAMRGEIPAHLGNMT